MNRHSPPQIFILAVFFIILIAPIFSPLMPSERIWGELQVTSDDYSPRDVFRSIMRIPQIYSRYFNDHYLLHDQQVEAFNRFRLSVLKEKEFPNVLIGKEDWLYYTGENNIKDFECTFPYTRTELSALIDRLNNWNDQLDALGVEFYVLIAPNKESIYPQYLPEGIRSGWGACRIDQVMGALHSTNLQVVDPRSKLKAAAEQAQVYHRTDTHWNDTGALIAAEELLTLIKNDHSNFYIPEFGLYTAEHRSFSGDLASFIPADPRFIEQSVFLIPEGGRTSKITQGEGRLVLSKNEDVSLPSILVFRDSFADALTPFLAEFFSKGLYVHSFSVDFDLVEQEKPDFVILEIAQRYLGVLR